MKPKINTARIAKALKRRGNFGYLHKMRSRYAAALGEVDEELESILTYSATLKRIREIREQNLSSDFYDYERGRINLGAAAPAIQAYAAMDAGVGSGAAVTDANAAQQQSDDSVLRRLSDLPPPTDAEKNKIQRLMRAAFYGENSADALERYLNAKTRFKTQDVLSQMLLGVDPETKMRFLKYAADFEKNMVDTVLKEKTKPLEDKKERILASQKQLRAVEKGLGRIAPVTMARYRVAQILHTFAERLDPDDGRKSAARPNERGPAPALA